MEPDNPPFNSNRYFELNEEDEGEGEPDSNELRNLEQNPYESAGFVSSMVIALNFLEINNY